MRLIAHNDGRELRGSERQLLLLARGLRARGHEILISCRAGAPLEAALARSDVETTGIRPRGDLALPSALAFRRLVARRRPDAVLLTSWKRVAIGAWAARGSTDRVIARLGIVRAMPAGGWSAARLRRALESRVDALVVNSEAVARAVAEGAPWLDRARLRVIRNGVELRPVPERDEGLRRALGLGGAGPLLLSVAGLEPRKGIDVLLRALVELPGARLAVAGDGPERAALEALARTLGVDERVSWLGIRGDVGSLLAAADAFVLPTRRDSLPNALLEAMAAGVPVVTTAGNGAEEALAGGEGRPPAGWIVRPDDPAALAAATREALAGAPDRSAEARRRATEWFGVPRMVDAYASILFGDGRERPHLP